VIYGLLYDSTSFIQAGLAQLVKIRSGKVFFYRTTQLRISYTLPDGTTGRVRTASGTLLFVRHGIKVQTISDMHIFP
jgi:hypothetical protein